MKKRLLIIFAALLISSAVLTGCGTSKSDQTDKTKATDKTTTTDKSVTDKTATDKTATDKTATDKAATDKAATDKTSTDKTATDTTKKATKLEPAVPTADDKKIIMKIDGDPVSYAEYRYYFLNYKYEFDKGDETYWDKNPKMADQFKKSVLDSIKLNRVVMKLAKDDKLTLTKKEIQTQVTDMTASTIEQNGKDKYKDLLKQYHMTDTLFRNLQKVYATYDKLNKKYCTNGGKFTGITDAEVVKYAQENNYIRAKHILIKTEGLSDAEKAKKKELAQQVLEKAKKGEDFDALIKQYGEDPGMTSNPDGYYFKKGDMMTEFETAAYAMTADQISDIVETTYGYHIIKRLANEDKTLIKSVKDKAESDAALKKLDTLMYGKVDKVKVVYTNEKEFKTYDFKTVK